MWSGSPFDNFMFRFIPVLGCLIFILVFAVFVMFIVKNLRENLKNSSMPKVSVPARLVSKRAHMWRGNGDMSGHTSYYSTFELENGDRMELPVGASFYGLHTEGDTGMLTHQGTRFYNFERERI